MRKLQQRALRLDCRVHFGVCEVENIFSWVKKRIPLRELSIILFYFIKQRNISSFFSSRVSHLSWVDIHLVLLNVREKFL